MSDVAVRSQAAGRPDPLTVNWVRLPREEMDARLQAGSRPVLAIVRDLIPARLAASLLSEMSVDSALRPGELGRAARVGIVERLTKYPLAWTGHEGYQKAEVTGGGVALGEVNPATLESRVAPALFLCGEILDAFGPIGGYNFAWAWATGRAAGLGAART
jgi:predicted flavoprotein YhiN